MGGGGEGYVVDILLNGMSSFEKGMAMFAVKRVNIQNAHVIMRLDYVNVILGSIQNLFRK